MGNHIKVIKKEVETDEGLHVLLLSDIIIEMTSFDPSMIIGNISLENLDNVFLVKIFRPQFFQEEIMILWQIGEGLLGPNELSFFIYDDNEATKEMLEGLRKYKSPNKIIFTEKKDYKRMIVSE
jgi:hypothetical protein